MQDIFLKTIFNKGSKGSKGDTGVNFEIPTNSILAYDGDTPPDGFVETTDPTSGLVTPAIELLINGAAQGEAVVGKANYSYNANYGSNYSSYLSFDATSKEFTVLQSFYALILPWTYEYDNASQTYPHGEFYINNTLANSWDVDNRSAGYYRGNPIIRQLQANDTMYGYTPVTDGYPQQCVKIFKLRDLDTFNSIQDIYSFYNEYCNEEGYYLPT